ncbi:MAG TPA: hypothetical protein VNE16_06325 [Vicinamibacterales bacterium]|nr:hypothetical protein [Vicinamibacterales bacterium]
MSAEANCRRLVSRGDLPGSNGGIYNPGCLRLGHSIALLCRREIDFRATPLVFPELVLLDPDTLEVVGHRTLLKVGFELDERIEDFRCLTFEGMNLAVHSLVCPARIKPVISRVLSDALAHDDPFDLPIALDPIEKNWVLFVHDGALHCLYRLDPLLIFVRQPDRSWGLVKEKHNGWADSVERTLSNSTNLIPFEEGYLGFWHTQLAGRYVQGAFFLDRHLDIRYRTGILLDGECVKEPVKPGVLYVESLLEHNGQVLAFYGEGDAHTGVAIFDRAELCQELQRCPFEPLETIQVGYEGESMSDLFRAMQTLVSFATECQPARIRLFVADIRLHRTIHEMKTPNVMLSTRPPVMPDAVLVGRTGQLAWTRGTPPICG